MGSEASERNEWLRRRSAGWNDSTGRWFTGATIFLTLTGLSIYLLPFSAFNQHAVVLHTLFGLVFLVPGAVFDRHGYRVGLGGGYYDRLLSRLPATTSRVGLIYDQWLHPEVPTEPHDEPVNLIITECAVYPITPTPEASV